MTKRKKKSTTFWIAKDISGTAFLYNDKPERCDGYWISPSYVQEYLCKFWVRKLGGALKTRARKLTVTWED